LITAKDVMTRTVLSAQPDWPVEQLADFLVSNSISGAPVTSESGELIGVVSLTDVARASTLSDLDLSEAERHDYYARLLDEPSPSDRLDYVPAKEHSQIRVQEIMTPIVLDVNEDTPVREVAEKMVDARVHRLFVTREGKVVGIISALDLLKLIVET
jgi:CBS domain-containing protein